MAKMTAKDEVSRDISIGICIGIGFLIVFAIIFVILLRSASASNVTKVEAQSPQRFEFQAVGEWGWHGETSPKTAYFTVAAICDTANGNLVYISGSSQSSPAIDKGGCQKNPPK